MAQRSELVGWWDDRLVQRDNLPVLGLRMKAASLLHAFFRSCCGRETQIFQHPLDFSQLLRKESLQSIAIGVVAGVQGVLYIIQRFLNRTELDLVVRRGFVDSRLDGVENSFGCRHIGFDTFNLESENTVSTISIVNRGRMYMHGQILL
jgi:hypothetical protein